MPLRLYNTLTRKKEIFKPIEKGKVKMYGCGPTVYWFQHIGNMRRYVFEDILKRTLLANSYKVKHVINITDVGHLTSDADEGEDKMMKAIKREGLPLTEKSLLKISKKYEDVFFNDFKKLNIIDPDVWPKATEHVKEMIKIVKDLEKKGYAYETSTAVYFDASKYKNYSKLGKLNLEEQHGGKRVKLDKEKKNPYDFALWFKAVGKNANHIMQWDSPWGKGFPGWHIECSAMSMKYLGESFDIHTGGEEHVPVHHTNEIAQSESATGKKWVNYWLHVRWLLVKGEKMSKSKGHLFLISDLEKKEYFPLDFRYLCLLTHYRKPLNFTFKNLDSAKNSLERLKNILTELKKSNEKINSKNLELAKKQFIIFLNDDLNTPRAVSYLWEILRDNRLNDSTKYALAIEFDKVFGLDLGKVEKIIVPKKVKDLILERNIARKQKDFVTADKYREKIKKLGYKVDDTDEGSVIKRI